MTDDLVVFANDEDGGCGDFTAWIDSDALVSNARMTVLSVSPLRLRDNITGEEFGLERATHVEISDGSLLARFGPPPGGVPERSEGQ